MEELLKEGEYQPSHPAPWIEKIVEEEFESAKTVGIKRLYWERKHIINIPEKLFSKSDFVRNLRIISLSVNQLTTLPQSFSNCESLQELDLSSNKFELIPSAILQLQNLEKLKFERNLLKCLPNSFTTLKKLKIISFFGNQITEINDDCFADMTELREVDLECNHLSIVPQSLVDLQSVTEDFILKVDDFSPPKKPVRTTKKRKRTTKQKAPPAKRQRRK